MQNEPWQMTSLIDLIHVVRSFFVRDVVTRWETVEKKKERTCKHFEEINDTLKDLDKRLFRRKRYVQSHLIRVSLYQVL